MPNRQNNPHRIIQDGSIHPTRIEEVVEKATRQVHKQIKQYGEDAALRAGAMSLHPEIITLLGKLKFRFSYGQNVLDHSLEVSNLMGLMAAELGLDVRLAKRIGLLHDMGKAVSHEIEGSHAVIGHDLALRYGEPKETWPMELAATTMRCLLRPSKRAYAAPPMPSQPHAPAPASKPVEEYIKRLKRLEEIAHEYPGVEKAYAMQAGREVLIVVVPDAIDETAPPPSRATSPNGSRKNSPTPARSRSQSSAKNGSSNTLFDFTTEA